MRKINCLLCDNDQSEFLYQVQDRLLGIEGEFTLVRCPECGLLYLNPQPTREEIALFYPAEYDPYIDATTDRASRLNRASVNYGMRKRCRAVTQHKSGGRLLEIGCATGTFLAAMRALGTWNVFGVDTSEYAVQKARDQLGLDVFHGQIEEARFLDSFFDVVVLWDVLEHLPDPKSTLLEIRRVLTNNGLLIFRVPSMDSLDSKLFGPYWAGLDAPRHFSVFSRATLGRLLETTGFYLERITCFSGTYPAFVLSVRFWARDHLPPRTQAWVRKALESLAVRILVTPLFKVVDWLKKSTVITVHAKPMTTVFSFAPCPGSSNHG